MALTMHCVSTWAYVVV